MKKNDTSFVLAEHEKKILVKASPRVGLVVANFYADIAAELIAGAEDVLRIANIETKIYYVMGALEIPPAIALLDDKHDIYLALGAVIRGETSHYDIVANESARGLMDLGINKKMIIGNAILTVDNMAQATARANRGSGNKGGFAAMAALRLWMIDKT